MAQAAYVVKPNGRLVGNARLAWEMRQKLDRQGRHVHSWREIAERCGYNSPEAAMTLAKRYGEGLNRSEEGWSEQLPWDVAPHQRREYIYLMLLLVLKRRAGVKITAGELGRLELFIETLRDLGVVIGYNSDLKLFFQRERRPEDDPELPFVRE